ncbi:HK97 family phage prohead protease [Carboxylicivirga sp. RSCT41]|uniref:HK97 family phage prohead protease n=1 Tax=Carboxylicivirga agarovorans TaxID=3417570 RepID=UPI003D359389
MNDNKTPKIIIRSDADSGNQYLDITAIKFNEDSKIGTIKENGKTIIERVEKTALDDTDLSDVIATVQHEKGKILGRTKSETLSIKITDNELIASVLIGDTQLHRDTIEMVNRGDLYESSFRAIITDYDDEYLGGNKILRTIKKISILKDVSIVTEGAYANTPVKIITRSGEDDEKNNHDNLMSDEEINELKEKVASLEKEIERAKQEPEKDEQEKEPEKGDEKVEDEPSKKDEQEPEKEEKDEQEPEKEEKEEKEPEKVEEDTDKEIERSASEKNELKNIMNEKTQLEIIRQAINTESAKNTIEISRAAGDGESSNFTKLTPQSVAQLDIVGKAPIWAEMGVDYMPGCSGVITLPYEDAIVAEQLAELASVTKQTETDNGTVVSAKRYQATKVWTLETLSNMTNEGLEAQINNLRQSIDRKVTADVFNAVFTGATVVAGVTAVDEAGVDALAEACDIDNEYSFVMSRSMFYSKKSVKIDSGSGINLFKKSGKFGETFDGDKVYFSTLSPVANKIAGGDMSKITVLDFDNEHVIIDNVTLSDKGQVKVTVVKMLAVALRNPNAFSVSGVIV